jgi:SAM-dependent methyltransferase
MKVDMVADNLLDWMALKVNLIPTPYVHILHAAIGSKCVLTALKLDVFEVMREAPETVERIAEKTTLHPKVLEKMLNILVCLGYLSRRGGKYRLTRRSRKWCLKGSPLNLGDCAAAFEVDCAHVADHFEEFLKTGKGIDIHSVLTPDQWQAYQDGMVFNGKYWGRGTARAVPVPPNPRQMLDIGGSHGLFSIELCKRHPTLRSTILDLPHAVERGRRMLAQTNMGDRIDYRTGDVLVEDLGENVYDLVLMASVAHHLDEEQNIAVAKKVAKSLKPGGYFVIQEWPIGEGIYGTDMIGRAIDLCWSLQSSSGGWRVDQLKSFQQQAGLLHPKAKRVMPPPFVLVSAVKSR